jgi:chorismate mutase
MNNIANIGQIFMNFQAAIAGIRSECENLKTQVSSLQLEFNNLKTSSLATNNEEKDALYESFNKLTAHVEEIRNNTLEQTNNIIASLSTRLHVVEQNEYLSKDDVKSLIDTSSLATNNEEKDALYENFNKLTAYVEEIRNNNLEQTNNIIASLSTRLHVVEQKEYLSKDDVKSLIDKSLSVLLEGLTFENHSLTTSSNGLLDVQLPPILETTSESKSSEEDEVNTISDSKEIVVENILLDTNATNQSATTKKGRGRGKKSTTL